MRGALQFTQGFFVENVVFPGVNGVGNLHVHEGGFWMWRVAGIRLSVNLASGLDSITFDESRTIPIDPFDDTTARTEFNQVITRRGFIIPELGELPTGFNYSFAGRLEHDPNERDDLGWFIESLFIAELDGDLFSTSPSLTLNTETGASVVIQAFDPIRNRNYLHSQPIYGEPSSSLTGGVLVEPTSFYPWVDTLGNPYYDPSTGARVSTP